MKKKLSFPTIVGILTLVVVVVAFKSSLFDETMIPGGDTGWYYKPFILWSTFWIMGVGMATFIAGRSGIKINPPLLIAGIFVTLYTVGLPIKSAILGLSDGKIAFDILKYDFLHVYFPYRKYSFELYFTYALDIIGGYLLACGLYGKRKADVTDKEDREP